MYRFSSTDSGDTAQRHDLKARWIHSILLVGQQLESSIAFFSSSSQERFLLEINQEF